MLTWKGSKSFWNLKKKTIKCYCTSSNKITFLCGKISAWNNHLNTQSRQRDVAQLNRVVSHDFHSRTNWTKWPCARVHVFIILLNTLSIGAWWCVYALDVTVLCVCGFSCLVLSFANTSYLNHSSVNLWSRLYMHFPWDRQRKWTSAIWWHQVRVIHVLWCHTSPSNHWNKSAQQVKQQCVWNCKSGLC